MSKELNKETNLACYPEDVQAWLNDWSNIKAWMGPSLVSIEMLSDHLDRLKVLIEKIENLNQYA